MPTPAKGQTLNNALLGSAETENHQTEPWKQVLRTERLFSALLCRQLWASPVIPCKAICQFQDFHRILPWALFSMGISPAQLKRSQVNHFLHHLSPVITCRALINEEQTTQKALFSLSYRMKDQIQQAGFFSNFSFLKKSCN